MAKLSAFRQNGTAIANGEWVDVGPDYDGMEIHTRGFTDAYYDAQNAKQRRLANKEFGGDLAAIPSARRREINLACLIEHVLLTPPVRNLAHDEGPRAGEQVIAEEFYELIANPDYPELMLACFKAAAKVGQMRTEVLDEAKGNFVPRSTGS